MARGLWTGIGATAFAVVLLLTAGARPAPAADFECATFLSMHGMLRRASATCGFTAYNPVIVDRARVCFNAICSRHGTEEIRSGVAEFERPSTVTMQSAQPWPLSSR